MQPIPWKTPQPLCNWLRSPGGSVKLILVMLVNLVTLQQSHRKRVGISSDGHPSVQWGIGEAHLLH